MKTLVLFLALALCSSPLRAETITLACGFEQKSQAYLVTEAVVAEIARQTGMEIAVAPYPRARMFKMIQEEANQIHGMAAAPDNQEKDFANLVKVTEPILVQKIVAVSPKKDLQINGWDSLKGLRLAHVRGSKLIETRVAKAGLESYPLVGAQQGLLFIKNNRADVLLTTPMLVGSLLKDPQFGEIKILEPALEDNVYFSYFYGKHKDLAEKFQKALAAIKADGTYQKIVQEIK